ncbi:MAG: trimethylamine methyltransferase family protein [Chloroflexota bacterium]
MTNEKQSPPRTKKRRRTSSRVQRLEGAKRKALFFPPTIARNIPAYELLGEEGIEKLENHAEWILSEVGVKIEGDPVAVQLFKDAGATVTDDLIRFDRGHVRTLCQTAPKTYTMYARNPQRHIKFGGDHIILAPAYGPPFVTDMKKGRRDGTIKDFENFIKLTYLSPWLHHQSGAVCEPNDVPVNKRHLDMVYAHLRYSDKPFMGSTTAPERAEDSLEMARLVFGEAYMKDHLVIQGNTNVNSPLMYDHITTSAIRTYAAANQGNVISPFIISGAMSPVTQGAVAAQAHAEAMVGVALTQLVRKGAPVVYGAFITTMNLKTGAPTFGTPESKLANMAFTQLGRRLGLPIRSGGHLTASKLVDAQSMQESVDTMMPSILSGANFILQSAGWLEGGLTTGYEKFVIDADRCGSIPKTVQGLALDENDLAADAFQEAGAGSNFLGVAHTMRNYKTVNYEAELADTDPFEQWVEGGSKDLHQRAYEKWTTMLAEYEPPPIDPGVDEALRDFVAKKKASMEDAWY